MVDSWSGALKQIGPVVLSVGVSLGFAFAFLGGLQTGLGATTAGNAVGNIVANLNNTVSTYFPLVLLAVFIGVAYIAISYFTNQTSK